MRPGGPLVSCGRGTIGSSGLMSAGACTVRSNASWVIVISGPPCGQTDTHLGKHYLPATSLVGGNDETDVLN